MKLEDTASGSAGAAYRLPDGFLLLSSELSADEQKAVVNTVVLAYAAADKAHAADRAREEWRNSLNETLGKVGWVYQQTGGEASQSSELSETVSRVSQELPAALRDQAGNAVERALSSTDVPEPAPSTDAAATSESIVFNVFAGFRQGPELRSSVVQIVATRSTRVDPTPRQGARQTETSVDYRWRVALATLNRASYGQVALAVASKVEPVLARYLSPVAPGKS